MRAIKKVIKSLKIGGERGIAMVTAIMLVLAFAVLGAAALIATTGEVNMTKNTGDSAKALSIAEAGVSFVAEDMPDTFSALAAYNPVASVGTKSFAGGQFQVTGYAADPVSPYRKIVTVEGRRLDAQNQTVAKKIVRATISVIPQSFRYALFSEKQIDLSVQNSLASIYVNGNMRPNDFLRITHNNNGIMPFVSTQYSVTYYGLSVNNDSSSPYPAPYNPLPSNYRTMTDYITVPEVPVVTNVGTTSSRHFKPSNHFQTVFGNTATNFPGKVVYYITDNYDYIVYNTTNFGGSVYDNAGKIINSSTNKVPGNAAPNSTNSPKKVIFEVLASGGVRANSPSTGGMKIWRKPANEEWTSFPRRDTATGVTPTATTPMLLGASSNLMLDENSIIIVEGNVEIFGSGNFNHMLAAYTPGDLSQVRTPIQIQDDDSTYDGDNYESALFEWGSVLIRDGATSTSNITFNSPNGLGIYAINLSVERKYNNTAAPTRFNFGSSGDGCLIYARNNFYALDNDGVNSEKLILNVFGSIISKGPEPTTHYYELLLGGLDDGYQQVVSPAIDENDGPRSASRHTITITYDASYLSDLPRFWVDDPNLRIYPVITDWQDLR